MIDFHTHILPNLDDGARTIEEAQRLLKEARIAGFNGVVFTSHYVENYYETSVKEREIWLNSFSKKVREIRNVKMYLGSEILLSKNIMKQLETAQASTINNTSYVLFELPIDEEPEYLFECIYNLMKNKVVPILAHPEKCSYVQKDPDILYELVTKGVYIQADYGSIIGENGQRAKMLMEKMLESNLVHFLGSNVHRENTIYKFIPEILEIIQEKIGKEMLNELTTKNPELALNNKRITMREPKQIEFNIKEKIKMFFSK